MTARIRTLLGPRWATAISIALCLPLVLMIGSAGLDYEPPFVPLLNRYLLAANGEGPTAVGRVVMLPLLLSVPAAFVINLLAMRRKPELDEAPAFNPTTAHTALGLSLLLGVLAIFAGLVLNELRPFVRPLGAAAFAINLLAMRPKPDSEEAPAFTPTPAHTVLGLSLLLVVLAIFAGLVLNELRPFVRPLGAAAFLGQGLCPLALLPLPVAFLLNWLPRFTESRAARLFYPTSINLIVGAVSLLIVLMLVSGLALETTACAIGVPNCD